MNRRAARPSRTIAAVVAGVALCLAGLLSVGLMAPQPALAAKPTAAPTFTPGRHVYDYGHLLSLGAVATAEKLAAKIEADGGGRVVVYTADLMALPDDATLARTWKVDGLLLTGWDDMGTATLGSKLKGKLSAGAADFVAFSVGANSLESWVTSTLARAEGLLTGKHVFDGAGALDAAGVADAESAATSLSSRIGVPVYVDIAIGYKGNPQTTAFLNNWAGGSDELDKSLVIALAVSGNQIGGYVDADSDYWDSYDTSSPWTQDTLINETAPNGDVQAELLRAIDGVHETPNPGEAMGNVAGGVSDAASAGFNAVTRFFSDRTNQTDSLIGALVGLLAVAIFAIVRRRRRHEPGYADDDSVLLPAPPADMTPALAALVAAPLDTTRAVTVALLDLAAHGHIAFYQETTPMGPRGGIKVVSAGGASENTFARHAVAASRPLGPAEQFLLDGLQAAAGKGANLSPTEFVELRPLFEQTGEQLERIAGQRGWLRLETRSVSAAWVIAGAALLVVTVVWALVRQPVAAACEAVAGLIVLPRATRMPLPLRTSDGALTSAMVDAYRRTLKRALAGGPGEVPPWLANAEEAALWGYAWGLEGEVQAFVGRSVTQAMDGTASDGTTGEEMDLGSFKLMLGGLSGAGPSRPVGLDTDAIANTLNGLGRSMSGAAPSGSQTTGGPGSPSR